VVARVEGTAGGVTTGQHARPLKGLLGRVVAELTEALEVVRVVEQREVTFVRLLVVCDVRTGIQPEGEAVGAHRLLA